MTYTYDSEGNPLPFYQLSQDSGTQLPPTPLSGLIDSTVDPTAVNDPLDPNGQAAAGSISAPATPFGDLSTPNLSALTGIQPNAPSMMGQTTGNEIVNQMFAPQKNNASDIVNQMFAPKGSTATVTPERPKIDPNSWIGQFMGWETKNLPEPISTGLNSALENIVPGAAGLAGYGGGSAIGGAIGAGLTEAGIGAGIGAFAGLGIGDEVTIPLGAIIGFVGGMAGMFGAQALASSAQGAGLKAVMGDQQYNAYTQMRAQQDQQNPVASLVGQFTGMGMFMRPNLSQLLSASKLAGMFMKSGDVSIFADPANAAGLKALMAVGMGSGSQAGLTALTQIQQGNFQPAQLAASALLGGLFNHNTKLGDQLVKYGSLGRIDPNEINRNVDAAKATVEDAGKASTGETAASTRPITTEEQQKAQEAFNAAQANYTALKEAKAPKEELVQARGALQQAAQAVREQQVGTAQTITSQAQSNPAQLQAQLHDQATQAQAEQLAAREQEQVPHAVENGTTTLRPDEFYHATPNVNSTLYARKFGAGQGPDSSDYSLRLTKDPATAAQHLADVQGGPNPGLVAVKMRDGHTTVGDGNEVTGIPSEVKSIRRYRNASGSAVPTEQGAQLQAPVMQPARMAIVQSRDATWARQVAAKESGLHVQAIDPAPENITSLRTELYGPVASKHEDLQSLNQINDALTDAQRGLSLVIGRDVKGELVAAASYRKMYAGEWDDAIGPTYEIRSAGSVEPGAGPRLLTEIGRTALHDDSGLMVYPPKGEGEFYDKLGFREMGEGGYALTASSLARLVDRFDQVTDRSGRVREIPTPEPEARKFTTPMQEQMLSRAEKMGARQVLPSQVVTGWIFPDGHGLQLSGSMIHDDVLNGAGMPVKAFSTFLDEGAIRVATTRGDVAYHTGPTLTNTILKRIEDNLTAQASTDNERHVILWNRGGSSRFDVADFINNDFDLQRTIQRTDQTLANLASNTLKSIREQFERPPESGPILSEARRDINGETRAVAGMDPRMMGVLGGNLYDGPLDVITVKESLQNAVDSVRSLGGDGQISVSYESPMGDESRGPVIAIRDNGHGMLPDVVYKEFVDLGGSLKEEGSSGGYGIAKVALFANAKYIQVASVARDPKTGKKILTELSGSGADWMDSDRGLKVETREVPQSEQTGSDMSFTLNPETQVAGFEAKEFAQKFLNYSNVGTKFSFTFDGQPLEGSSVMPELTKSRTLMIPGGNIDVYASRNTEKARWGIGKAIILNKGIYQFSRDYYSKEDGVELPKHLVLDVNSTAGPEEENYPFRPDRQGLRADAEREVETYLKEEVLGDAQARMAEQIKNAFQAAPRIAGTDYRVVDLDGRIDKALVHQVATSPYIHGILIRAGDALQGMREAAGPGFENATLDGISLSNEHLGVNISGRAIRGDDSHANAILINPFVIHDEVKRILEMNDSLTRYPTSVSPRNLGDPNYWMAKNVAARIVSTLVHEVGHERARSHDESFAGVLTRLMDQTMDAAYESVIHLTDYLAENDYAILNQLRDDSSSFAGRMGANEIFKHAGVGLAAGEDRPGGSQGNPEASGQQGAGLEGALPAGSGKSAKPMAFSPERDRRFAAVKQFGSTPEEFGKRYYFHGTDARGAEELRKTGALRPGSSVTDHYSVAHEFASQRGGKLTGGYSEGGGSVFGVPVDDVEVAHANIVMDMAEALQKKEGISIDDAVRRIYDEHPDLVDAGWVGNLPEKITAAKHQVAFEVPHDKAATIDQAYKYLTQEKGHGVSKKATSNTQEAGGRGQGYKASEVFQALEARAFGYGVKADQPEDRGGGLGSNAAQPDGAGTESSAQDAAASSVANGGSGTGNVANATGNGGSPDAGGNATTAGNAGTGDAGTLANGGTSGTAAGNGISGTESRDAGSAAVDGSPNGPSGARAGGLRTPSLERNDATGSANAEAATGSAGNGQADVRNAPYAQLGPEAGTAGGSAAHAPVVVTGAAKDQFKGVEADVLARINAAGLNDNGLIHEVHVGQLEANYLGIYRLNYRHSVEVDPETMRDSVPVESDNLMRQARVEFDKLPEEIRPQYEAARQELEAAIQRQSGSSLADRFLAVLGHEFIHPQLYEAKRGLHQAEVTASGSAYHFDPHNETRLDDAYRQMRYLPPALLDNMASMGMENEVSTLRNWYNEINTEANGRVLTSDQIVDRTAYHLNDDMTGPQLGAIGDATYDLEEHLNALIMGARGIGIHDYSQATDEAYNWSVWDRQGNREGQALADQWLRASASPATEAPYLRSSYPSSPDRANALAAQRDYYATRSAADWGGDRAPADQRSLVYAKKLPGEIQPAFTERQRLQTRTSEAAALPRRPGETDAAFADRVAAKGGFSSADHVNRIIAAANGTDPVPTVERNGQTYVKLDTEEYKGTPASQVKGMAAKFRSIVGGAKQAVVDETMRQEPPVDNNGQIAPDKVYADMVQPRLDGQKGIAQQEAAAAKSAGKTPPVPLTDQQYSQIHETAHVGMETGILGTDLAAENGPFDPIAVERETAAQAPTPAVTESTPTGASPSPVSEPTGLGVDTSELRDRLNRIPGIRYSKEQKAIMASAQKWLDFTQAFNTARALPHLAGLADDLHTILTQAAGLHEFDALSADAGVWVNRTVGAINGMNVRVSEAGKKLDDIIGTDTALNDRLTKAIDTGDASGLSPEEAAQANLQHHYWQLTGDMAERLKMVGMALEHYLPHMILKEANGRIAALGRAFNRSTTSTISRLVDEEGNQLFRTLDDLEKELGPGSVERNLAKLFVAHGKGWNSALLYNNLIRKGITDLRLSKTGLEGHNVIVDARTWKGMAPVERTTYRPITTGPMKTGLAGYYVAAPMAERIERLTPSSEMNAPVEHFARNINRLNGWFKEIKFIGPMHIWSMMSNMTSLTSKLGYAGLPPMFDPTVYKIMGRGAEIRKTPTLLARAYEAGIPLPGPGEEMNNAIGLLDRLPVVGNFFHWWHNFMWQTVGHNGMLGVWEYLAKDYANQYQAKHGVMPFGADLKALDAYAANDTRRALGFLTDLDMNKDYRLYSNSVLLAAKWSTSQLRVLGDAFGIKFFSELGGGQRLPMGSGAAQEIGANKSAEMARRLLIGGWARLAMTSLVMGSAISALITGTPSTPVQNYMRDPMHTFDIYAGRDPQTNQDRWVHMPIYMFQREFMDWAMASVRAFNDGKNPIDITLAPGERYFSKANPILRTGLESVMGREIGKWMNGYGDNSDIDNDKAIQNIHKSLDNLGIGLPSWAGSLENRLIYAIRSVSPLQAAFPTNPTTPVSGYDLATALGPGTYNLADPRNLAGLAGARLDKGVQYETNAQTGQEQSVSQAVQASQARTAQIQTMIEAVKRGDFTAADTIRQQLGLTPGQFKEYVTFGASHTTDTGLYAAAPQQGVALAHQAKISNLFGVQLNTAQQTQYFNLQSHREEEALQMAMNAPGWKNMSSSEHQALGAQWLAFADKISAEQYGQAIGARPGKPITDAQASKMLRDAYSIESDVTGKLQSDPNYKSAIPQVQQQMMAERQAAAKSAVWQAAVGNLKGLNNAQLENVIAVQVGVKDNVTAYVKTLQGFQQAPDIYSQQQYMTKAMSWADTMVADAFAGKKADNSLSGPLKPEQVWGVVKNGLALQDAALQMLHQSSVYTEALPTDQTKLDNTYSTLAHRIALIDQRDNVDLSTQGALYQHGFGQALQSRLMADEGYKQLEDTFGGSAALQKNIAELSALKAQFAQEKGVPTAKLASYNALIQAWYVQNNPQFGAFLNARTLWEQRNPIGQLYAAFNRDELAYAAAEDPVAQQLLDQANSDTAAATLPGY